jgi:hypothetical protein
VNEAEELDTRSRPCPGAGWRDLHSKTLECGPLTELFDLAAQVVSVSPCLWKYAATEGEAPWLSASSKAWLLRLP